MARQKYQRYYVLYTIGGMVGPFAGYFMGVGSLLDCLLRISPIVELATTPHIRDRFPMGKSSPDLPCPCVSEYAAIVLFGLLALPTFIRRHYPTPSGGVNPAGEVLLVTQWDTGWRWAGYVQVWTNIPERTVHRIFIYWKISLTTWPPMWRSIHSSARMGKSRFSNVLPLEEFLFRQRLKSIYRDVLRVVYKNHEKESLLQHVQAEFRINAKETDLNHRRYLLTLGLKQINEMATMMGLRTKEFRWSIDF